LKAEIADSVDRGGTRDLRRLFTCGRLGGGRLDGGFLLVNVGLATSFLRGERGMM
jgi:hypothetical protein